MMDYTELIAELNRSTVGYAGLLGRAVTAIEALQTRVTELEEGAHQDGLLRVRYGQQIDTLQARVTELENLTTGMATRTDAMVQTAYTERDAALAKLEALEKQEPVAYQFQTIDGGWHPFLDEKHYQNTAADGRWPIRALYLAPVPAKTLSEPEIEATVNVIANGNGDIEYPNRFVFVRAIETALKGGA